MNLIKYSIIGQINIELNKLIKGDYYEENICCNSYVL